MGKYIVITEKPSVAEEVAIFLGINHNKQKGYYEGNDYIVSWALGHLVRLGEPEEQNPVWKDWNFDNMPIFPEEFKYFVNNASKNYEIQFNIIKKLIHRSDVIGIINAGDTDREGCLLQDLIYTHAGNRKPVYRLEFQSVTQKEIAEAWENIYEENEANKRKILAGYLRQQEDWLDGYNYSRYYTIVYDTIALAIGRLKAVICGMVYKREKEIQNFVSTPFYQLSAEVDNSIYTYWTSDDGNSFTEKESAEMMCNKLLGKQGVITSFETERKKSSPPHLYNLSEIQQDAVKMYGITSAETLAILQNLYAVHKITTYPRTDAKTIKEVMAHEMPELMNCIATYKGMQGDVKTSELASELLDNGLNLGKHAVNDKGIVSHHAIIVNENLATFNGNLSREEQLILDLIIKRMVIAFSEPYIYDETVLLIECEGENLKASGKMPVQQGFKEIQKALGNSSGSKDKEEGNVFPPLEIGQEVTVTNMEIVEKFTKAPKPYTEDSLIKDMESASKFITDKELKKILGDAEGVGTSATRGDTIKELISKRHYLERGNEKNPVIYTTEEGRFLCQILPEKLISPEYTALFEYKLKQVENGSISYDEFMNDVKVDIIETINSSQYYEIEIPKNLKKDAFSVENRSLGTCPICKEGYVLPTKEGNRYYCNNYSNGCNFNAYTEDKGFSFVAGKDKGKDRKITKTIMKSFLRDGSASVGGKRISVTWYGKEWNGKKYHDYKKE